MAVTTEPKTTPERGTAVVGGTDPKIDAHAKATGQTVYADDIHLPRMLVGRLLRSPRSTLVGRAVKSSSVLASAALISSGTAGIKREDRLKTGNQTRDSTRVAGIASTDMHDA